MTRIEILHTLQKIDKFWVTEKEAEAIDGAIKFLDVGIDCDEDAYEQGFKDGMADERRRISARNDIIHEIEGMVADINVDEIQAHDEAMLPMWVSAWRGKMMELLDDIKSHAEPIHPLPFEDEKEVSE